jgi:hypothetical protein
MEEMRNAYNILVGKLKGRNQSEDFGVGGKIIIIILILGKYGGKLWNGFIWLRIGTSGGLL